MKILLPKGGRCLLRKGERRISEENKEGAEEYKRWLAERIEVEGIDAEVGIGTYDLLAAAKNGGQVIISR